MRRRTFLRGMGGLTVAPLGLEAVGAVAVSAAGAGAGAGLLAAGPAPLVEPHFPDRIHQFVWRNWELANVERLAEVLECRPEDVLAVGASMGLPPKLRLTDDQLRRGYITVFRQNWHLLPNDQLVRLLGWTEERFRFTLKEDDFLDVKLGPKPDCAPLRHTPPDENARRRAAEIRRQTHRLLGKDPSNEGEPAFAFVKRLSDPSPAPRREPSARPAADQLDLSGASVQGGPGVDPGIVERLDDYLKTAMRAGPKREGAPTISLGVDRALGAEGEHFRVRVEPSSVELIGNGAGGLVQAANWLRDQMDEHGGPFLTKGTTERRAAFYPRHLYSFFALYGDPLIEPDIDPFPEGLLEKLSRVGASGVWLQGVLNTLAPSKTFPEFGKGSDARLEALAKLVERAGRYGMRVFLYLNEPRAMPAGFFQRPGREAMRGAESRGSYAMCTAAPEVRAWIADGLEHIFNRVPKLGGVFSITMSENLTNCYSVGNPASCPRCSKRPNWGEGVEEALRAIHEGVRRASADAEVIAWDWGWRDEQARYLIPRLPRDSKFQSVSEWSKPVERGGVKTRVGEYSISVVGPGPRASAHWKLARAAGVPTMAKVQLNNTWEISAVPYVPAANLVARHCTNLAAAGVNGLQESWTLGGYPSPNLEIAREVCFAPQDGADAVLERVARRRYGAKAAPLVLQAWKGFSDAFEEFPYGVQVYLVPTQHGPANLLRARPSGAAVGMILFPQDAYRAWAGAYPPEVMRDQFVKMADLWDKALPLFQKAVELVPETRRASAGEDLAIAETCSIHFRSAANQMAFYLVRDGKPDDERLPRMRAIARDEIALARRMYALARAHSVLAFEATNHYYYRPLDLVEKILHCQYLLDHELRG